MKQPTLTDVARHAGVSYATADRVINRRGNVAPKSTRKVEDAVRVLGYVRNVAAANLSKNRTYRFAFILPDSENAFYSRMRGHIEDTAKNLHDERIHIEVQSVEAFRVDALCAHLNSLVESNFDGISVVGLDREKLAAPLTALRDQGVAITSLVSDLPQGHRSSYIGIDNKTAGRTAGRLMGLAHGGQPGTVQVLAGSLASSDHSDRFSGFKRVIDADFPHIELLPLVETSDDANKIRYLMEGLQNRQPSITGVYNIGAGNRGLVKALDRSMARPKLCVVHELVAHTRTALEQGLIDVVIDQRPDEEVLQAINVMRALSDQRQPPLSSELLPTIYVKDNIPTL